MLITEPKTWENKDKLQGLLLFCQRTLELSYDKSDFKEKGTSVFINDVIKEALEVVSFNQSHKNEVGSFDLDLILAELISKIKHDNTVKEILGDKREYYLSKLISNGDTKVLINTLEVLKLKINPRKYFEKIKVRIKNLLETNKYKEIHQATTRLFEFLIWYGYQKGTIYYLLNREFFDKSGRQKVRTVDDIDRYFDLFDLKAKEFEVVFVGSKLFKEIEDSCAQFNLRVISERDAKYDEVLESKFYRNNHDKKVFLLCDKIRAVDYLHAMKVAEGKVSLVADLFAVFHHKSKPWHSDYCLVYKHDKSNVINIKKPNNIMTNISEGDLASAKKILPIFLRKFNMQKDSFDRFNRGVELHSLSLETDEVASQILNFWICLETLLITDKNGSHISSVSKSIELIQKSSILDSKVTSLKDLLKQWNDTCLHDIKVDLPEELAESSEKDILAALVSVVDLKDVAGKLLKKMTDQPLLRLKFMSLVESFQKKEDLKKVLRQESSSSVSDIRRIYRARNKIVHQGNTSGHSDFIVEAAHYYLDLVLFSIIERQIAFDDIRSIDNFINELVISVDCHSHYIDALGTERVKLQNYKGAIFGSSS
ncbi:hypothetical protein [Vibrio sp. WXL210]|uniref:hypothetical protein n=1 Tax=Vibrio sp. WXL210 TaxID=3450709 RepID=UPI003EC6EE88